MTNYETKLTELAEVAKVARGSMSLPQFSEAIKAKLGREGVDMIVLHAELKSGKLKLPDEKAVKRTESSEVGTVTPLKAVDHVKVVEHTGVPVQVLVQAIPSANHELLITGTWTALVARGLAWFQPYALGMMTGLVFANAIRKVVG